jgi:hypothetical protein
VSVSPLLAVCMGLTETQTAWACALRLHLNVQNFVLLNRLFLFSKSCLGFSKTLFLRMLAAVCVSCLFTKTSFRFTKTSFRFTKHFKGPILRGHLRPSLLGAAGQPANLFQAQTGCGQPPWVSRPTGQPLPCFHPHTTLKYLYLCTA